MMASGVSDRPRLAMRWAAALAAPRMPLVRAVPWSCDMAGESGVESSLSSESDRSPPSRAALLPLPPRPPAMGRLNRRLSSMSRAAPGSTDETMEVRIVRWRSFRSGSWGPPRLVVERFCLRCSRENMVSVRSSSASVFSYR